jgi:hypothetical protein
MPLTFEDTVTLSDAFAAFTLDRQYISDPLCYFHTALCFARHC